MGRKGMVVYPHLPHYRAGVFSEMDKFSRYDFVFVAATEGVRGIRTIPVGVVKNFVPVRNRYVKKFLWQFGLFEALARESPDFVVLLADPHYISSTALALWCRLRRVPVFFWTHGWTGAGRGARDRVKRLYFRLANHLLLYGSIGRRFGSESGFPESRMSVIYNSIEVEPLENADSDIDSPLCREIMDFCAEGRSVIGAVARLQKVKSLDQIISAAAYVRDKYPRYASLGVLLVGEGSEMGALRNQADRLNVPLLMPGASYHPADLECFYKHVQVTVMPDKVGLTGIQSMAHGVPVLSNGDPEGQMPEWEAIRPGKTGDHFLRGDPESLGEAIVRLLNSGSLKGECLEEYWQRWSPEAHGREIEKFLDGYFGEQR